LVRPDNPFDPRAPARDPDHFAGRRDELASFTEGATSTARGEARHFLVVGPSGAGKTTLLRAFARQAEAAGVMPVTLALNRAVVEPPLELFRAMLIAATRALARTGSPASSASGEAPSFTALDRSELAPYLLPEDFGQLLEHARLKSFSGVAFLVDEADPLAFAADPVVVDALGQLLDELGHISLTIAGSSALWKELHSTSVGFARRFERVLLGGFQHTYEVQECILRRLPLSTQLSREAATDIARVTKRLPRGVVSVARHVWRHTDPGKDEEFSLSSEVLLLVHAYRHLAAIGTDAEEQLRRRGERLDELRALQDEDVMRAANLAQFEDMSLTEYALATRLNARVAGPAPTETLDETVERLGQELDELVSRGLVQREHDRFRVVGDEFTRVFLKYEARGRGAAKQRTLGESDTYAGFASRHLLDLMMDELKALASDEPVSQSVGLFDDPKNKDIGVGLDELIEAADRGDPVKGAECKIVFATASTVEPEAARQAKPYGATMLGVLVEVAADDDFNFVSVAQVLSVRWNDGTVTQAAAEEAVNGWVRARTDELAGYRLRVRRADVRVWDRAYADAFAALVADRTVPQQTFTYYRAGRLEEAQRYITTVLRAFGEAHARKSYLVDAEELVDAHVRHAFVAALLGEADAAEDSLVESGRLSGDGGPLHQRYLQCYNQGYVRALRGEFAAAAALARTAVGLIPPSPAAELLLYLPTVSGWHPSSTTWNTTWVDDAAEATAVFNAQALVYEALAGRFNAREYAQQLSSVFDATRHSAVLRLAAWAWLARYRDPERASPLLREAAATEPKIAAEASFSETLSAQRG